VCLLRRASYSIIVYISSLQPFTDKGWAEEQSVAESPLYHFILSIN